MPQAAAPIGPTTSNMVSSVPVITCLGQAAARISFIAGDCENAAIECLASSCGQQRPASACSPSPAAGWQPISSSGLDRGCTPRQNRLMQVSLTGPSTEACATAAMCLWPGADRAARTKDGDPQQHVGQVPHPEAAPPHLKMTIDPNCYSPKGSPWQPDQMSSTSRMKPKVKLNSRPATVAMYCLPFSWQCSGISLKSPLVSSMTTIHAAGHSSCPQTTAV